MRVTTCPSCNHSISRAAFKPFRDFTPYRNDLHVCPVCDSAVPLKRKSRAGRLVAFLLCVGTGFGCYYLHQRGESVWVMLGMVAMALFLGFSLRQSREE